MRKLFLLFIAMVAVWSAKATESIKLWKDKESKNNWSVMTVYEPSEGNKSKIGVIVCPGGSYYHLALSNEGSNVAKWLAENGITAFVLRYRVAVVGSYYPAAIEDLQRAMQLIKENSVELGVDSTKVGVMGFSAGGHLAGMLATYYDKEYITKKGVKLNSSLKPAFAAMIYPVVTMDDEIVHRRSRKSLIGSNKSKELRDLLSLEKNIRDDMPPMFLVCSKDDPVVDYRNSEEYDKALSAKGTNHFFEMYQHSGHGFGISTVGGDNDWCEEFMKWLPSVVNYSETTTQQAIQQKN